MRRIDRLNIYLCWNDRVERAGNGMWVEVEHGRNSRVGEGCTVDDMPVCNVGDKLGG